MSTKRGQAHWCAKFGQAYANQLRRRRPGPGDTWHLDEVFVTIKPTRPTSSWLLSTTAGLHRALADLHDQIFQGGAISPVCRYW